MTVAKWLKCQTIAREIDVSEQCFAGVWISHIKPDLLWFGLIYDVNLAVWNRLSWNYATYARLSCTCILFHQTAYTIPDSKVHVAHMGPTWVLSAPGGPHAGPMNLAIRDILHVFTHILYVYPWHQVYNHSSASDVTLENMGKIGRSLTNYNNARKC